MKVLGLTGGIASGKSLVSKYFKLKGFKVIDADQIVHELYEEKEVIQFIDETFHVVTNQAIDRKALSQIIYHNPSEKARLENYIHPLVYARIETQIHLYDEPWVIVDIPLLYETQGEKICDLVMVIFVDLKTQIARLMHRDQIDESQAMLKINAQMPLDIKISKADIVIDNSSTIEKTYQKIDHIIETILI